MTNAAPKVSVRRVYNNNVVLAVEEDSTEVVLLGKGIGFQRRPGDQLDPSHADQRFVADGTYRPTQVAGVLSDAPLDQISLAQEITALGHAVLGLEPRQSLMIPVLDHLSFAVRRAQEGIHVDFPLRWEVAQLYPGEAALGRQVVALVQDRLGVQLQEDEWVAFALHYVNQQWAKADLSSTVRMTETLSRVFKRLDERWGLQVDERSMSTARFVTHLRFVFARAARGEELNSVPSTLITSVQQAYPEASEVAQDVADLIGEVLRRTLSSNEVLYLTLHTGRLLEDMKNQRS